MQEYITNSPEETQEIAKEMAKTLKGGEIFVLTGDLGAGKTTFIQGLAKGLGVEQNLTSPTFVLMKIYNTKNNLKLVHLDCYRINSAVALSDLGLDEIFENKKNITVIEWGEKVASVLPENVVKMKFEYVDKGKRSIEISNFKF